MVGCSVGFRHRATFTSSLGESGALCFFRELDAFPHRGMCLFKLRHHMRLFGFMSAMTRFDAPRGHHFVLKLSSGAATLAAMLDRVAWRSNFEAEKKILEPAYNGRGYSSIVWRVGVSLGGPFSVMKSSSLHLTEYFFFWRISKRAPRKRTEQTKRCGLGSGLGFGSCKAGILIYENLASLGKLRTLLVGYSIHCIQDV